MKHRIEREKFDILFFKNGITELVLKDNIVIELRDSIEQEHLLNQHMPEEGYLLLVTSGPSTSITKESRLYANENPLKANAMAIISKSLPQKIIANFMITVYSKKMPDYPMKLFVNREKALDWLLEKKR